jgi:hypothetical protein
MGREQVRESSGALVTEDNEVNAELRARMELKLTVYRVIIRPVVL